jgi:hypothetical protein
VLLPLTTHSSYCPSFGILLVYVDTTRTRITENTCHMTATQPVHWPAGWTYRKHVTWQLSTLAVTSFHLRRSVFTEPLPRNWFNNSIALLLCVGPCVCVCVCVLRALLSNGFTRHIIYYLKQYYFFKHNNAFGCVLKLNPNLTYRKLRNTISFKTIHLLELAHSLHLRISHCCRVYVVNENILDYECCQLFRLSEHWMNIRMLSEQWTGKYVEGTVLTFGGNEETQ